MAKMDGAVGVRRTIVEKVDGTAGGGLPYLVIEASFCPPPEPKGLILGQIRFHGEGGLGEGKGRLQLRRRGHKKLRLGSKNLLRTQCKRRKWKFPGNKEVAVSVLLFMEVGKIAEYETVEFCRLRGSDLEGQDK
jgi:hypothetical protein